MVTITAAPMIGKNDEVRDLAPPLSTSSRGNNSPFNRQASSPLWHRALEKYIDELQGAEDYQTVQNVQSLEELIDSFSSIQATAGSSSGVISLRRLAPRLKFVDAFSAVLALCFGADAALTAAVWGSIRLILMHASSAAETLQDVLDMLEELSLTLPRLQVYEQALPLNRQLQQALVDVYCEIICFYAKAIHFLRSNPHMVLRKNAWQTFRNDFSRTIMRIKRMPSTVESEADLARMRKEEVRYREVIELLSTPKAGQSESSKRVRYNNIPFPPSTKFSGREDVLDAVQKSLDPKESRSLFKSMALFGMGGIGKTQIAIQYAYQNLDYFEVILWIAAANAITIRQSFRAIAEGLGLLGTEYERKDGAAATWKTKNWLLTTESTCLVIFDNADDIAALKLAWPGSISGSVFVTTRDFVVATSLATQHVQVDALADEQGSRMLLKAIEISHISASDAGHSLAISRKFGGLPLALTQVGGFIAQRRLSLHDFLPLYKEYSAKIDARKTPGSDYEYTLSTVWNVSFEKLTETSNQLLNLLSFFDPDSISENVLLQGSHVLEGRFSFLSDTME
ncbi:hypothetical protein CDD83_7012 [Cordyceps sp. RAO-2017]|nr:hypothetical protein CDD83_7012 [Cordyceps sp. RAO-2017]